MFNQYDKNGDGQITAEELQSAMAKLGNQLAKEDIKRIIRMADKNSIFHLPTIIKKLAFYNVFNQRFQKF